MVHSKPILKQRESELIRHTMLSAPSPMSPFLNRNECSKTYVISESISVITQSTSSDGGFGRDILLMHPKGAKL